MENAPRDSAADLGPSAPYLHSRELWIQLGLFLVLVASGYLAASLLPPLLLRLGYGLVMVAVSYTDLRERRIPNRITYPSIAFALGAAGIYPPGWPSALAGGAAAALLLAVPVLIYGAERAGIGDVKLGLFIGLVLGFSRALFQALLFGFAAAALVGVMGILLGRLHLRSLLPFGPFMSLGAIVGLFVISA